MNRFFLTLSIVLGAGCSAPSSKMNPDSLDGTSWTLRSIETDADTLHRQLDTMPMLHFRDGGVTGSDGCNRISGDALLSDGGMVFGPLAMTKRACAPAIEAVAAPLNTALSEQTLRVSFAQDGLEMTLRSADAALIYVRSGPEGLGPDTYDDDGVLECAVGEAALEEACGVRVVHGAGSVALWIENVASRDMERYRVLTFADRTFSARDGSAVSATALDGAWLVEVGVERYLIPALLVAAR